MSRTEIKRWHAGFDPIGDQLIVVCATLIETERTWRLKDKYGAPERAFRRIADDKSKWSKSKWLVPGFDTAEAALADYERRAELEVKAAYNRWNNKSKAFALLKRKLVKKDWIVIDA